MNTVHAINILTLSPLHIGNGNKLTSVGEYMATTDNIGLIDQDELNKLIVNNTDLRKRYLDFILKNKENTNIWKFFQEEKIDDKIIYTKLIRLNATNFNAESNNMLELAVETNGEKYIPGSSLKGSLRTMAFVYLINNDNALRKQVEKIILDKDKKLKEIKNDILVIEKEILDDVFGKIIVEDSQTVKDENLIIEIVKRTHLFGIDTEGLDNLRECINENVKMKSTIKVKPGIINTDLAFLNEPNFFNFFQMISKMMIRYIDFEKNLLQKSPAPISKTVIDQLDAIKNKISDPTNKSAYIRIGKGKTYLFQLILPFLSDECINRVIELKVKDETKRKNYPQTRVLTGNNQMFGWVSLSVPEFSIEDINFFDNQVEFPEERVTSLKAYFLETKKACLMYNGVLYSSVQLINQLKTEFKQGQEIEVILQQMNNAGKICQVKLD